MFCLIINFYNQTVFQKYERSFCDQVVIDAKMCKHLKSFL